MLGSIELEQYWRDEYLSIILFIAVVVIEVFLDLTDLWYIIIHIVLQAVQVDSFAHTRESRRSPIFLFVEKWTNKY